MKKSQHTRRITVAQLWFLAFCCLGLVLGALCSSASIYADETRTFTTTGQTLSDRVGFLAFWQANGGEPLLGAPVTGEFDEHGLTVQYFERARLEYHPEYAGAPVMLGRIGADYAAALWRTFPLPTGEMILPGATLFQETGHTLSEPFRTFWQQHGAMVNFGYPLSEPTWEFVTTTMVQVQYFERGRLEFDPNARGTADAIRMSSLGRDLALLRGNTIQMVAPVAPPKPTARPAQQPVAKPAANAVAPAAPTATGKRIIVNLDRQWLYAYQAGKLVFDAPVSTGRDGFNTPLGTFAVYSKTPAQTMSGTIGGESYYVPNVPNVMYINGGVALHGTYWHNQFGTGIRRSHGCINLPLDAAAWLYTWAPLGTVVEVR